MKLIATFLTLTSLLEIIICQKTGPPYFLDPTVLPEETKFCRAWSAWYANTTTCQCLPKNDFVECHDFTNRTTLKYQGCLTYDANTSLGYAGKCPYNRLYLHKGMVVFVPVENINLTAFMCGPLNRTGLLCSHCREGMGPALLNYSHPCLECSKYGWFLYFTATLLPSTVFLVIILTFRIDAFSPSLNYFILHSQILFLLVQSFPGVFHSISEKNFLAGSFSIFVFTCYGVWNLDFFRLLIPSFCISSDMNIRTVLALEYVVALYPLLLTLLLYGVVELHSRGCKPITLLWKPFHPLFYRFRKVFNIRGSIINAFATFIFLSYSKIFATSANLLFTTHLYSSSNSTLRGSAYLLYNASIPYADTGNIPFFLLAGTMIAIFCLLPFLVLLLFHTRICHRLHDLKLLLEVVKTCQKHFKDGTNGTRNFCFFSSFMLAIRTLIFATFSLRLGSADMARVFITTLVVACVYPYQRKIHNYVAIFSLSGLTTLMYGFQSITLREQDHDSGFVAVLISLGLVLPLLHICVLSLWKCLSISKQVQCVKHLRHISQRYWKGKNPPDQLPDRFINPTEYKPLLQKYLY